MIRTSFSSCDVRISIKYKEVFKEKAYVYISCMKTCNIYIRPIKETVSKSHAMNGAEYIINLRSDI